MDRKPYSLICWFLLHLLLGCTVCIGAFAEKRGIYLALMDTDPVEFIQPKQGRSNTSSAGNMAVDERVKLLVESHDRLLHTRLESGSYEKLYSFRHIFNGFAVHTTLSQAKRLESAEGVAMVEKDRGVKLMTTYTPHFLGLPEGVWDQEGGPENAGEGIIIGFVDTGIDPSHPSFAYDPGNKTKESWDPRFSGSCDVGPMFPFGSCNGKIVSARHFWAGASKTLPIGPPRELSPFDEIGHGTHVASIAAGNKGVPVVVNGFNYGYASGMAPRARIAVYKALYAQGGTLADVISAVDQAIRDRVDVLTLSIGPDDPPDEAPTFMNIFDIMLLFARREGIFVAQAAGNKGPRGATVISFSPWSMAVAASTTNRNYTTTLVLGNGNQLHGVGLSGPTFGNGHLQFKLISAKDAMVVNGNLSITPQYAEECQHAEALQPMLVQGSIVICNFSSGFINGTSTVDAIINTGRASGFMGFVLVANPSFGDLVAEPLPFTVPGIIIPRIESTKILMDYYENQTTRGPSGSVVKYNGRAAIKEGRVASFEDIPPVVARFSSRGPDVIDNLLNPADVLKPDILAPGHQIWGACSPMSARDPIFRGYNFALLSGTSMATPHVAGIGALIKQNKPTWNPSMIASALSTTASNADKLGRVIMSQGLEINTLYPSTPFDYGSGLINPSKALDPGLVFSSVFEDYVAFLCSIPNIDTTRVVKATGKTCNTSLPSPADLNLPSITVSVLKGYQIVKRQVMNVGDKSETYLSSVLPPRGVEVDVQPPWFTISPQGTQDLQIMLKAADSLQGFTFGEIVLTGSLDHIVRLPLSTFPISVS